MEVELPALLGNYVRQTNQPTDLRVHWVATLQTTASTIVGGFLDLSFGITKELMNLRIIYREKLDDSIVIY